MSRSLVFALLGVVDASAPPTWWAEPVLDALAVTVFGLIVTLVISWFRRRDTDKALRVEVFGDPRIGEDGLKKKLADMTKFCGDCKQHQSDQQAALREELLGELRIEQDRSAKLEADIRVINEQLVGIREALARIEAQLTDLAGNTPRPRPIPRQQTGGGGRGGAT